MKVILGGTDRESSARLGRCPCARTMRWRAPACVHDAHASPSTGSTAKCALSTMGLSPSRCAIRCDFPLRHETRAKSAGDASGDSNACVSRGARGSEAILAHPERKDGSRKAGLTTFGNRNQSKPVGDFPGHHPTKREPNNCTASKKSLEPWSVTSWARKIARKSSAN